MPEGEFWLEILGRYKWKWDGHPFHDLQCLWGAWELAWGGEKRTRGERSYINKLSWDCRILVLGQVLQKSVEWACRRTGCKWGLYTYFHILIFHDSMAHFLCEASPPPPPPLDSFSMFMSFLCYLVDISATNINHIGSNWFSEVSLSLLVLSLSGSLSVSRLLVNVYHRPGTVLISWKNYLE